MGGQKIKYKIHESKKIDTYLFHINFNRNLPVLDEQGILFQQDHVLVQQVCEDFPI